MEKDTQISMFQRQTAPGESGMIKHIGKLTWQVRHLTKDKAGTRDPTFGCWIKSKGTSDQGHQVCRRRWWIPSFWCPVTFHLWQE
jgi:hypothetical protein